MVDRDEIFRHQALKWLRGLTELAGVSPDDIIIHHTHRTSPDDVAEFTRRGIRTRAIKVINPRRPHCNKIEQLRSSFLQEADLAVLCDCDTLFVTDPRPYLPAGAVAAAVVDRPNPPLSVFEVLLNRAGLSRQCPDIPTTVGKEMTLFENRNGGLYSLPGPLLPALHPCWRKWAEWLEGHTDVLQTYAFHIDQISFALACIEMKIEPALLPAGMNYPAHMAAHRLADTAPVMLHYHRSVEDDGTIKPSGHPVVGSAISHVNAQLARPARLKVRRRLVLHVGLPKTGTSSLQLWSFNHREQLRAQGIGYPAPSEGTAMPKHQFIVTDLQRGRFERTQQALAECDEPTVILSTEGLTNHLYDFRPAALQAFRTLLEDFEISIFMTYRQPEAWLKSYHKQCEINPGNDAYHYGMGLDVAAFGQLPRVRRLLDIGMLKQDCLAAFGAKEIVAVDFDDDWAGRFVELCGYRPAGPVVMGRVNESVPDWIFDAVLRINRQKLPAEARTAWLGTLQRVSATRHSGLMQYDLKATTTGLWRHLDPSLIEKIATPDDCWNGYDGLVRDLIAAAGTPDMICPGTATGTETGTATGTKTAATVTGRA
ncbi:hypothetical protein [Aquisalinus flavus]|uniref:hypothetical protein n=1 Tax=Aquisalinus flavus TaxID=1526572 RepID=UPI00165FA77A|nr:hypothetical protein [Aquisalinus flavus]MBD0425940.1 hypothetical protein [Aquisalinus flavus]UNE48466.1 hypothetical protein FF099_10610 [Aquisalinus flavus]